MARDEAHDVVGYEVLSIEGKTIGRVAQLTDDLLIIEHGIGPRKSRHGLPLVFASPRPAERQVVSTLSKQVILSGPKLTGSEVDHHAIAAHFGLEVEFEEGSAD